MGKRRKKIKRAAKAVSIPIFATAFMLWVGSKALSGASASVDGAAVPFENLKREWKSVLGGAAIAVAMTLVGRKMRIGARIPGLVSLKP